MFTVRSENTALDTQALYSWMSQLRHHAYAPFSNFAVAVVLEVVGKDKITYFAGVNVESAQYNRLSLHAEQTALNAMITCLGTTPRISRAFFLGAPFGEESSFSNVPVWPCGHCRQILLEFVDKNTLFQPITIAGQAVTPAKIDTLLPCHFSQDNLGGKLNQQTGMKSGAIRYFTEDMTTQPNISSLTPYILNPRYQTSTLNTAFVVCNDGVVIPGVLMQNAAFLTTDAIFAAVGNAVSRFGPKLKIQSIHHPKNTTIDPAALNFANQFGHAITLHDDAQAQIPERSI